MKRQRGENEMVQDGNDNVVVEHVLEAQLVCLYGFHCLGDMLKFGRTFHNKSFCNWMENYVYQKGVLICSKSSKHATKCSQKTRTDVKLLRPALLQSRPNKWFHIQCFITSDMYLYIEQYYLASSTIVLNDEIYATFTLIRNGKWEKSIQKRKIHPILIEYKYDIHGKVEKYNFLMKWNPNSV